MLGIKYPIIQGGMANIATGKFAATVSNAGGLGLIATGGLDAGRLEKEIADARSMTDKPFGVNLMLMNPDADNIADLLLKKAFCAMDAESDEGSAAEKEVEEEIVRTRAERESAAKAAGVDPSYLGRIYTCPYCHDTGYIEHEDGPAEKCRCFRKRESEILLKESGMAGMLDENNFSVMRTDIFDEDTKEHFLKAVEYCEGFINSFDTDYRNIMFCGTVGTGKSFLSSCIAKALLDTYHSVVYTSAKTLFDTLAEAQFSEDKKPEADALRSRYYDCDLLIIDDLGTEMTNSFVGT